VYLLIYVCLEMVSAEKGIFMSVIPFHSNNQIAGEVIRGKERNEKKTIQVGNHLLCKSVYFFSGKITGEKE